MKRKIEKEIREWFIVLSESGYFKGLKDGGQTVVWTNSYNEAKPLDDERKFSALKSICFNTELLLEYI